MYNYYSSTMTALVAVILVITHCSVAIHGPCTNGAIRLAGEWRSSGYAASGNVEICLNNQWGGICSDRWMTEDAQVVCKQLGYSSDGAVPLTDNYYGSSSVEAIHLHGVQCTGDESYLFQCNTSNIGECTHQQVIGVACQGSNFSCQSGDVRLSGGTQLHEGRVEVCKDNLFGTICDDQWDNIDANVICNQLGYANDGAISLSQAAYGEGIGPLFFGDVICMGDEANITQCSYNPSTHCTHSEDASVVCKPVNPSCEDGSVRLVNGRTPNEGRVEVCYNGVWGTICHDFWDDTDAGVVCNQLGFSTEGAKAIKYADFGEGEGPIFLDNVMCTGSELHLNECTSNPVGSHNCRHNKDVGVICQDPTISCTNGDIRLVGGQSQNEGRVEICYDNHFGTICEDKWTHQDAQVVCNQLGYSYQGSFAIKGNQYGSGVGMIYLDDLECKGSESNLLECTHRGVGVSNCYHHQDAGVLCRNDSNSCQDGSVRLMNGTVPNEGRVEVCVNGVWTSICDSEWTQNDASIVCNQLGYDQGEAIAVPGGHYSSGDGLSLISSVSCTGNESGILSCIDLSMIGSESCVDRHYAGVICPVTGSGSCRDGDVRLVAGGYPNQGRVEVCYSGVWGSVCDETWDVGDASVVCKQLGYNMTQTRSIPVLGGVFGSSDKLVLLGDVDCYGVEGNLFQCKGANVGNHACPGSRDVGVVCEAHPCREGDIRLTGGRREEEGAMEVCHHGEWVGIDIELLSTKHIGQLCTHMGYSDTGSFSKTGLFRTSSKTMSVDITKCNDIVSCLVDEMTQSATMTTNEPVGVICSAGRDQACTTGDVRLAGGSSFIEGRVEVCIGGQWGTICDDTWDNKAAAVVCKQLNLPSSNAKGYGNARYGMGTGDILLDNVQCIGNETEILHCFTGSIMSHNCHHKEDASVRCEDILSMVHTESPPQSTITMTRPSPTESVMVTNPPGITSELFNTTTITIPVVSLVTVCILAICLTIIIVALFKWRKLRLISKMNNERDSNSNRTISSMGKSPSPSDLA